MEQSLVICENVQPAVAVVRMNRPEKRNALNIALMQELRKVLDALSEDETMRVLILQGEGPVFCSGIDICEAGDEECIEESARSLAALFTALYTTSLITISTAQGAALAGGAGLMAACDFALAAEGTQVGFPEVRRGLVAAQVMTFLVRNIQKRYISELVLLGESVDAKRAQEMGLVHTVLPPDQLLPHALTIADKVLKGAPGAVMETKRVIEALHPASFADDLFHALIHHHKVRHSTESKEGISAFLQKRSPNWQ